MTKTDIPSPRPKRKQVSTRTRFNVFKRDGFRCKYCGVTADRAQLHLDHIIPLAAGGIDHPCNLVSACADCNRGKATSLVVVPRSYDPCDQIAAIMDFWGVAFTRYQADVMRDMFLSSCNHDGLFSCVDRHASAEAILARMFVAEGFPA